MGRYVTTDRVSEQEEQQGLLQTVYKDGNILVDYTLEQVRANSLK